jgi:hypothetical protein
VGESGEALVAMGDVSSPECWRLCEPIGELLMGTMSANTKRVLEDSSERNRTEQLLNDRPFRIYQQCHRCCYLFDVSTNEHSSLLSVRVSKQYSN